MDPAREPALLRVSYKPSAAQDMEVAWALIQEIGDLTSAQCERLIQILDREFPFPIYIPEKIGKRELT